MSLEQQLISRYFQETLVRYGVIGLLRKSNHCLIMSNSKIIVNCICQSLIYYYLLIRIINLDSLDNNVNSLYVLLLYSFII